MCEMPDTTTTYTIVPTSDDVKTRCAKSRVTIHRKTRFKQTPLYVSCMVISAALMMLALNWNVETMGMKQGCLIFGNQGEWDSSLSTWSIHPTEAAQQDLATLRSFTGSFCRKTRNESRLFTGPHTGYSRARHFLFAGDSTMSRLFMNLPFPDLNQDPGSGVVTKSASRCDVMEYFGLPRAVKWKPPNATLEGPCLYGLENPFCTDCSGCNAQQRMFETQDLPTTTYEYIPMEFARDKEFQTESTRTSQATLALYLSKHPYKHDLCIASAGIHDIMLPNLSTAQFATNVVDYLSLLKPHCNKIVWLLPSASLNEPPQSNEGLLALGNSILDVCEKLSNNILLFNTWNMSLPSALHVDNVHHSDLYYNALARLIFHMK